MSMHSRRNFLKTGSAAALYGSAFLSGSRLAAQSLGLPLGLVLYSVREMLPTNYEGTLKQVAALGYREVEAVGWAKFYNHTPAQVKQAMKNTGLHCVSSHYSYEQLHMNPDQVIATNKAIGAKYLVCSSPGLDPSVKHRKQTGPEPNFTLQDWRWTAEQLNKLGGKVNGAGMKLAYHNHTMDFHKLDGVVPYDELLRLTDPSRVSMEMDCGWVVVGGADPVEYLRRYPTRFCMLHVKDFKRGNAQHRQFTADNPPPMAQLGQGFIDYRPIFQQAAKTGHIKHCFVEQEGSDIPRMASLKIDAEYMRKLNA
jgi:sugar phosphate isomerase/epimerase